MTITPEEVAKLAAAATLGPWCNTVQSGEITDAKGYYIGRAMLAGTSVGRANAAFIAAAHDMAALIAELEAKLASAVEALRFYAKEEHYVGEYVEDACGCCGSWYEPRIHKDGEDSGNLARATLASIKEKNDDYSI